ncbi:MAG: hypothetical protein R6V86_06505 [Spirochaetia bacterium]
MMNKVKNDLQELYQAVKNDPTIRDPSRILFSVEKKGPMFKKQECLLVEGSVANTTEFQKIEQILEQMNMEYEVINNLKVATPNL